MELYRNETDEEQGFFQKQYNKELDKKIFEKVTMKNRLNLVRKTYLKYLIVKFRQKISYIAFKNKMTIVEIFITAIKKSYLKLMKEGAINIDQKKFKKDNDCYDEL